MEEEIDYKSEYSVYNTLLKIDDHFLVKEEMRVRIYGTRKDCQVYADTICCVVDINRHEDVGSVQNYGNWIVFSFLCDGVKQVSMMNSRSYAASKCSTYLRDLNLDKLI